MTNKRTCTVICKIPGGLSLMASAGLGADSATPGLVLRNGPNHDVSRYAIEQWLRVPDPKLTVRRVPLTDTYVIERRV
jgi:hypothetical protein